MNKELILNRLKQHIGEFLERDVSNLTPETRFAKAFDNLESLKLFEMIVYLEECFNIEFDEMILDKIETIADLVTYVEEKQPT